MTFRTNFLTDRGQLGLKNGKHIYINSNYGHMLTGVTDTRRSEADVATNKRRYSLYVVR